MVVGIEWEGRRQVLGVEMARKEILLASSGPEKDGVVGAVSDDRPGSKRVIIEVLSEANWSGGCRTMCIFLRNVLD